MTNKQPSKQEIIDAIKKKADKVKQAKQNQSKQKQPNQTYIQPTQTINKVQSRDVQIVKQITKPSIESRMSNIIDNRCRYWIENRISQLLSSDNFTTREGYSFSIDNDRASAGLCFRFTKNGTTLAKIDSNGYLYCANVFSNGTNLLAISKFINDINSNSSIYVKHTELKNGTYVMDIKDIKTKYLKATNAEITSETVKDITITNEARIDSTLERPLTITNSDDNSTCSMNIGNQTIRGDKTNNKLILNDIIEAYADQYNTKYLTSNALYNYFTSNMAGNVFVFGKNYAPNNCVIINFRYTADNDDSNYFALNFHSSNDLIKLYKNAVSVNTFDYKQITSTNSQISSKIGYQDGNNGCFNILFQYAYNSADRYTSLGNQGYPCLKFWRDKLELLLPLYYNNTLVDFANIAYVNKNNIFTGNNAFNGNNTFNGTNTFTRPNTFNGANTFNESNTFNRVNIFNASNSFNANNTFTGTLNTFKEIHSASNWMELLYSSLNAGYEVIFNFGKSSGIYEGGNLAYHLESTLANSYITLYLNGMSGLNIYADKTQSITPFYCPSLYINGTQFDPTNVAYTNVSNTFTAKQLIQTSSSTDYSLMVSDSSANNTYLYIGRNISDAYGAMSLRHYYNGNSSFGTIGIKTDDFITLYYNTSNKRVYFNKKIDTYTSNPSNCFGGNMKSAIEQLIQNKIDVYDKEHFHQTVANESTEVSEMYKRFNACVMKSSTRNVICYSEQDAYVQSTPIKRFVAISDGYSYISNDGIYWDYYSGTPSYTYLGVAFSPGYGFTGIYCAITNSRNTWTSIDGHTWSMNSNALPSIIGTPTNIQWLQDFGYLVVVATNSDYYAYSYDGVSWNTGDFGYYGNRYSMCSLTLGGRHNMIAVGNDGMYWIGDIDHPSSSWTYGYFDYPNVSYTMNDICQGDTCLMAVGAGQYVFVSYDGYNWNKINSMCANGFNSITYGNGKFVLIPAGSSVVEAYITWDEGNTFVKYALPSYYTNWSRVVFGNGVFVATTSSNSPIMATYIDNNTYMSSRALLAAIYPVGAIYTSFSSVHPRQLFGFGEWTQISNRFLYCSSSSGSTGGNSTHTHPLSDNGYAKIATHGAGNVVYRERSTPQWTPTHKQNTSGYQTLPTYDQYGQCLGGDTDAASSMPPYITCYAWYRTG